MKKARWVFEFEYPDEMSDEDITDASTFDVVQSLMSREARPEITTVDDP